ncbi:DNRLRE domain-containing protein [Streptosporangium sp. CA-115845]|uniref:DNRLRE domain-containing protein n=1 Tax=Streptosporangium sp. CA-115845 TaxID=3240071 RepID=UPI003D90F25D
MRCLTGAWDENNLYWANKPPSTTEDAQINRAAINESCATWPGPMDWNVTGIAQDWAAGAANHGLVLQHPNETNTNDNYRVFTSAEDTDFATPPTLTVTTTGPASAPTVSGLAITPAQAAGGVTTVTSLTPQLAATRHHRRHPNRPVRNRARPGRHGAGHRPDLGRHLGGRGLRQPGHGHRPRGEVDRRVEGQVAGPRGQHRRVDHVGVVGLANSDRGRTQPDGEHLAGHPLTAGERCHHDHQPDPGPARHGHRPGHPAAARRGRTRTRPGRSRRAGKRPDLGRRRGQRRLRRPGQPRRSGREADRRLAGPLARPRGWRGLCIGLVGLAGRHRPTDQAWAGASRANERTRDPHRPELHRFRSASVERQGRHIHRP